MTGNLPRATTRRTLREQANGGNSIACSPSSCATRCGAEMLHGEHTINQCSATPETGLDFLALLCAGLLFPTHSRHGCRCRRLRVAQRRLELSDPSGPTKWMRQADAMSAFASCGLARVCGERNTRRLP